MCMFVCVFACVCVCFFGVLINTIFVVLLFCCFVVLLFSCFVLLFFCSFVALLWSRRTPPQSLFVQSYLTLNTTHLYLQKWNEKCTHKRRKYSYFTLNTFNYLVSTLNAQKANEKCTQKRRKTLIPYVKYFQLPCINLVCTESKRELYTEA